GQPAAGGKLVVIGAIGIGQVDVYAEGDRREPMRLPAGPHCRIEIGQHRRRLQMPLALMNRNLHTGVFQVDQALQGGIQRQVGKTSGASGNKHSQAPLATSRSSQARVAYREMAPRGNTTDLAKVARRPAFRRKSREATASTRDYA